MVNVTPERERRPRKSYADPIPMTHEVFARQCANGVPVEDAYRMAFHIPDTDATATFTAAAKRLSKNTRVLLRISAIRDILDTQAVANLQLSREYVIAGLMAVHEAALKEANLPSATRALELLGKVSSIQLFEDVVRDVTERFVIGAAPEGQEGATAAAKTDIESWARANGGVAAKSRSTTRAVNVPR